MKQMKLFLVLSLWLFISFYTSVYSQTKTIEIHGNVLDSESGVPINNVSVFLSFTTYHSQTNSVGEYSLDNVSPGTYALVLIAEGYQKVSYKIEVDAKNNLRANVLLNKVKPTMTLSIHKLGSLIERDKFLEKFKKEFLGESIRTYKCEIVNEDDLGFDHNGVEIFAESKKPIIILNKSLGYKLTIYLNKFEWEWFSDFGSFSFDVYFDEIKPAENFETIRFASNRIEAYKGSFRHFLKACADRKVYSEGFIVFETAYVPDELGEYEDFKDQVESQRSSKVSGLMESIVSKENDLYTLETDFYLEVIYTERKEEPNYSLYKERIYGANELYDFQDSWVKFPAGKYHFTSRGIGLENEEFGKQLFGYWNWKRVSDLLPSNYEPTENVE